MAGSEEDSIMDLVKNYILDKADLRAITEGLHKVSVATLLPLSENQLASLIGELCPAASAAAKWGVQAAIQDRKESSSHEGARPSKKAKLSRDVTLSLVTEVEAKTSYFEKLLEPPAELPRSVDQLKAFMSLRPGKLPLKSHAIFLAVSGPELVMFDTAAAVGSLTAFCETVFQSMSHPCPDNEATSSAELSHLTGNFLRFLNDEAPENRKLRSLRFRLDSANRTSTSAASQPLEPLRPDFQLFVKNCLILRWENKIDETRLGEAVHENITKLKTWSPLFYGKLPYVIGGCCAERQFQWLKLSPKGDKIVCEYISDQYDLNLLCDVAKFLHSTIRMHCLLQKLQEMIDHIIPVTLYLPKQRSSGGVVTIYPDLVMKEIPALDTAKWTVLNSLYELITGSRYLIQRQSFRITRNRTILQLQPVGYPYAKPDNLEDLGNAIHDMLNGLADLHGKGYTHRDLRWDNCIKVNDEINWKWVIIDLEAAGPDNEVWVGARLNGWDAGTLEGGNGRSKRKRKRRYTTGSDMYQLGKLIAEWLNDFSVGGKEERQVMRSRAEIMQQERTAAAKVLEDICKNGCQRCRMFGTKL